MIVNGIRPRSLRRWLTLIGLGGLLAAGILAMPAEAHADPSVGDVALANAAGICGLLTHEPTFQGVDEVAAQLLAQGWTEVTTGAVMRVAIDAVCPKFTPLLLAWANQTMDSGAYAI